MAELCKKSGIEPILLRPNTTHLTQALDLTFFASLKAGLKVAQELWHRDPVNIGFSLSKYTVINLVHSVTENILHDKPELIAKGFRKAGIVPWNPLAPTTDRMTPSMVYAQPEEQMLVQDQPQHQAEEVREKGGRKGQECADSDQEGLLDTVAKESEPDIEPSSVPLQSRFLSRYELLLSKEESRFCQEKWAGGESLDHPVYKAWEALKQGSLTTEELQSRQEQLVQNKQME